MSKHSQKSVSVRFTMVRIEQLSDALVKGRDVTEEEEIELLKGEIVLKNVCKPRFPHKMQNAGA